jgi:hypothetical protein
VPLITREVRWFFDGKLAAGGAATWAWFAGATVEGQGGGADRDAQPDDGRAEDWRTDRYLLLPDTDEVGVKVRQGRLEIKGRHALIGIQRFGDDLEGEVACWTKWTLAAPERAINSAGWSAIEANVSLCVAKLRVLRSVRFSEDGVIAAPAEQGAEPTLPGDSRGGPQGERQWSLQMELTRIRVAGADADTHWSLAFEAYPDDPSCCAPFVKAVASLLAGCPASPLGAGRSMSYPRWLQRLGPEMIRPGRSP